MAWIQLVGGSMGVDTSHAANKLTEIIFHPGEIALANCRVESWKNYWAELFLPTHYTLFFALPKKNLSSLLYLLLNILYYLLTSIRWTFSTEEEIDAVSFSSSLY